MPNASTHMRREILEIPEVISRFLTNSADEIAEAAKDIRAKDPALFITIARGSSDHAATFLKYAIELTSRVPVASLGPSVASIYQVNLNLENAVSLSISQSGASPDIIAATQMVHDNGALTMALTNQTSSALGDITDHSVNIEAGPELSVAATKTFVSSIVGGLALLAEWKEDVALKNALKAFPEHAQKAMDCTWDSLGKALEPDGSLFVLGRGPSWAIANEVALKLKETCSIHAEAYSAAEVMHGPMALVENGFPVLTLSARDAALQTSIEAADRLAGEGAVSFITANGASNSQKIDFVATGHPLTDALCLIIPFYIFVESHARALGMNPDQPPLLRKVTQTR